MILMSINIKKSNIKLIMRYKSDYCSLLAAAMTSRWQLWQIVNYCEYFMETWN